RGFSSTSVSAGAPCSSILVSSLHYRRASSCVSAMPSCHNFAGFDRLLRVCLHRAMPLHLVGPTGFADRVEHKLKAYTLNFLDEQSIFSSRLLSLPKRESTHVRIPRAGSLPPTRALTGTIGSRHLLDEDEFQIRSVVLDHGTPCLAFAFEEKL